MDRAFVRAVFRNVAGRTGVARGKSGAVTLYCVRLVLVQPELHYHLRRSQIQMAQPDLRLERARDRWPPSAACVPEDRPARSGPVA